MSGDVIRDSLLVAYAETLVIGALACKKGDANEDVLAAALAFERKYPREDGMQDIDMIIRRAKSLWVHEMHRRCEN